MQQRLGDAVRVVSVGDREHDLYDVYKSRLELTPGPCHGCDCPTDVDCPMIASAAGGDWLRRRTCRRMRRDRHAEQHIKYPRTRPR
jgi:hypothetical protein